MKLILKAGVCLMSAALLVAAPVTNTQNTKQQQLDATALIAPRYAKGQTKEEAYTVTELNKAMESLADNTFHGSSIYVKGKIGSKPTLNSGRFSFDLTDPVTKDVIYVYNLQSINNKNNFKSGDLAFDDEIIITGDVKKENGKLKVRYNPDSSVGCYLLEVVKPTISVSDAIKNTEKGQAVNVNGIISDVQASQGIFIQDKVTTEGLFCYRQNLPKDFKVGDEILVTGTFDDFHGTKQLKDTTILSKKPISSNNELKYKEISKVSEIYNNKSALVSIKGATLKSNAFGSTDNSDKKTKMDVNGEELVLFCKKDDKSYATAANAIFKNNDKDMTVYDIRGIAAVYENKGNVTHQILLTDNVEINVNAYESLIQTLMGADTANQCKTKFDIAKKYFFMCDEETQKAFKEGTLNEAAKTRYEAWAVALDKQPYTQDAGAQTSGLSMNNEMITISIVSIAIIAISAIAIFAMVKGKRKQTN